MSRGPAIVATVLALALINVGAATLIVTTMGSRSIAPPWVALALVGVGVVALVVAATLWRGYLTALRSPSRTDS